MKQGTNNKPFNAVNVININKYVVSFFFINLNINIYPKSKKLYFTLFVFQ